MALLDLQDLKQTDAATLQHASMLLKENEYLKEKLKTHLDLWELEKTQLEEHFFLEMRDHESKAVSQAFEIANLNLAVGFHQQETLHFKLRLEGAIDDVENLSLRLRALSLEIQEKEDKLSESNKGFLGVEASLKSNPACKYTKNVVEKMLLADGAKSHLLVLDELTKKHRKDVERLENENIALASQQQQEVSALIREKNFVWDQLKRMEDSYCARLNSKKDELKIAEKNVLNLQSKVDELQKAYDEKTVEATILKLNLQMVEEELHQLREELPKLDLVGSAKDNKGLCSKWLKSSKESSAPLVTATNLVLSSDEADCIGDLKEMRAALEIEGEQGKSDQQETVSQLSESTQQVCVEKDLMKMHKMMDELRLENQNLRMLYADLELQLKDKQIGGQKSEKTNRNTAKDGTTRNLAVELDAVANVSNQPYIKPAKCLVAKDACGSKMERKEMHSPVRNHDVNLDDSNMGTACVLNKTTEAQFSSLRRQRGLRSNEKTTQFTHLKNTKNKHAQTAEETKKVRARFQKDVRLSTSENASECQTYPRRKKLVPEFPDKSRSQKRTRSTPIDGYASPTEMRIESRRGQSLRVCRRNILSPRNPNMEIQKPEMGQQVPEVLPTKRENDKRDTAKGFVRGDSSSLGKTRLFSSVFNIPKLVAPH